MSADVEEKRPVMGKALRKFIARVVRLTLRDKLWDIRDRTTGYWDRLRQLQVKFRGQELVLKVEHSVDRCDTSENFDGTQRVDSDARYYNDIFVLDADTRKELFRTSTGAKELWIFLERAREKGFISR